MIVFSIVVTHICSLYALVLFHEWVHQCVARLLGYDAKIIKVGLLAYMVEYTNSHRPLDNLLIASSAPITLILIGWFVPINIYTVALKIACLCNVFNLLPFTGDGEVIILSLYQLFK